MTLPFLRRPAIVGNVAASHVFAPQVLFASGADGLLLDLQGSPYLYQAAAGTTAAGDGDVVGLALDRHSWGGRTLEQVLAGQSELFDPVAADSTVAGDAYEYISGGYYIVERDATNFGSIDLVVGTIAGRTYKVSLSADALGAKANHQADIRGILGYSAIGLSGPASIEFIAVSNYGSIYMSNPVQNWSWGAERSSVSIKQVPGNSAYQTTTSKRPLLTDSGGARYLAPDGSDDYLLTTAKAGAANTLAAKITVPTSLSATQVIAGLQADTSTRFYMAIDTGGHLCAGVGTDGATTIVGTSDLRGTTGVAILIADGSEVSLLWNGEAEYSDAQNGNPSTSVPFMVAALNDNGTPASYFGANTGRIHDLLTAQKALNASEIAALTAAWGGV